MIIMRDPIEQFRAAIAAAGLTPPEVIHADGKLHRFSSNGERGDDSGWYVFHADGVPAGAFGCWRLGLRRQWCAKESSEMTTAEREAHRLRVQAMKQQRDAEAAERQRQAAQAAAQRWEAARPATGAHPYLRRKGVQPHGLRMEGDALIVPMRGTDGALHGLQTIGPDGEKRFLPGARVGGCYHAIGRPEGVLIVCEGYATGASIHEATRHAVAVAFNAGNLEAVALALRGKYPDLKIILAADDDWRTEGNPGLAKATSAARAVGGSLAVPAFTEGRPDKATDFNDLHQLAGPEAVRACIEAAEPPEVGKVSVAEPWPEPEPLPEALPGVAAFDADLLPEALCGWVADIAERMQCPQDFPAVGALVAISSLIGARAVVAPKERDAWRVVPNLWGLVVGRPGVMKSPALSEALNPLTRLEATERERWQAEHEAWKADCKVHEMAAEQAEKEARKIAAQNPAKARALLSTQPLPPEPTERRYIVNDSSVEKLGEILESNPWGTLSYRDEIHGLLCSMDRQGQEGARAFYLQAYDGNQSYTFDRIGRGTHYIPRVCLAMLGSIQPGRLQSYVRDAAAGGAGDDGLLQRFGLTVWPDVNAEFKRVDKWPDTHARQAAWAVFERLNQLQPASGDEAHVWRFSPDAQALFWEWLTPFETEIRGAELHPALASHLAKYRKLIPALALIFALVDTPDSGNLIHERELLRALAWGDYLRTHAERMYAAAVIPETAGAKLLLDRISKGKLGSEPLEAFTPRQVAVKHWAALATPEAVRTAAELLTDYGWLAREAVPTGAAGGRPSERYLIHPKLLKGRA